MAANDGFRYIPSGNSKFGVISISDAEDAPGESKLHYRLIIDGKEVWEHDILSGKESTWLASSQAVSRRPLTKLWEGGLPWFGRSRQQEGV